MWWEERENKEPLPFVPAAKELGRIAAPVLRGAQEFYCPMGVWHPKGRMKGKRLGSDRAFPSALPDSAGQAYRGGNIIPLIGATICVPHCLPESLSVYSAHRGKNASSASSGAMFLCPPPLFSHILFGVCRNSVM